MGQRTKPMAVTEGFLFDSEVVFLPLQGRHRDRGPVILDRASWPHIERTVGSEWVCMITPNDPRGRVVSGRKDAVEGARLMLVPVGGGGEAPLLLLSRFVADAREGDTVFSINGNPMDLRSCNLEVANGHDLALLIADIERAKRPAVEVG